MPNLTIRIQRPSLEFRVNQEGPVCSVAFVGTFVRPDASSRSGFELRRGGLAVNGWEAPVQLVLRDASGRDPLVSEAGGAKLVTPVHGTITVHWWHDEGVTDDGPQGVSVLLDLETETFDRVTAALPAHGEGEVFISTVFRLAGPLRSTLNLDAGESHDQVLLRNGLTYGDDPDGRDLLWDVGVTRESVVEYFRISLTDSTGGVASAVDTPDGKLDGVAVLVTALAAQIHKSVSRVFWAVVVLGTLILAAVMLHG